MTLWHVERLGRRGDGVAVGDMGRALAPLTLPGEQVEGEAAGDDAGLVVVECPLVERESVGIARER